MPTETVPLINTIAKYIYHDNDAKLATLAAIVLRKICIVSMSILSLFYISKRHLAESV